MSEVMMSVLQAHVESLTRQVETLAPENERVRNLLTEFDNRHNEDCARIAKLKAALLAADELADAVQRECDNFGIEPFLEDALAAYRRAIAGGEA